MPDYTKVEEAKDTLVAMFAAAPGLAGIQVSYGVPRDLEQERLVVGGADIDQEWEAFARTREERFSIEFWLTIIQPGDSQREATQRARDLLRVVGQVVRDDHTLGGLVLVAELKPRRLNETPTDEGYASEFEGVIACRAIV